MTFLQATNSLLKESALVRDEFEFIEPDGSTPDPVNVMAHIGYKMGQAWSDVENAMYDQKITPQEYHDALLKLIDTFRKNLRTQDSFSKILDLEKDQLELS